MPEADAGVCVGEGSACQRACTSLARCWSAGVRHVSTVGCDDAKVTVLWGLQVSRGACGDLVHVKDKLQRQCTQKG